jgi:hypothetical protein
VTAGFSGIENVIGSPANDALTGAAGNNIYSFTNGWGPTPSAIPARRATPSISPP